MKGHFADIIIKTTRDSSDSRDKHINPNNSAAFMGLKNVSTPISVSSDSRDIKTEDWAKLQLTATSTLFGRSRVGRY